MQRLLTVLLSITTAVALASCGGGNSNSSSSTTTTTAASPAASPSTSAATMKSATGGKSAMTGGKNGGAIFTANCQSCHQANGKGQPGAFPPLAGNSVVTGDAAKVIHIVKDGLTGKIMVGTQSYNGMMPSWKASLSNADIAAVVTYIRSSWGNHAPAVTTAQVAAVK